MKNKPTICISPGHTAKSQGASRGNVTEYGLSSAIIGDLVFKLSKAGHTVHLIGSASNKKQIERINALKPDFGLELHFNANINTAVNGSMCLHSGYPKSQSLSINIQDNMIDLLKTENSGIHIGHYQLNRRKKIIDMIRLTHAPFIIVEPLYLSNDSDFSKIDIPLISTAILEGCLNYWGGKNA